MRIFARIIGTAALLAFIGVCIFGFLASYEYSEPSERLPWQVGYGMFGVMCLLGIAWLLRPRRHLKGSPKM